MEEYHSSSPSRNKDEGETTIIPLKLLHIGEKNEMLTYVCDASMKIKFENICARTSTDLNIIAEVLDAFVDTSILQVVIDPSNQEFFGWQVLEVHHGLTTRLVQKTRQTRMFVQVDFTRKTDLNTSDESINLRLPEFLQFLKILSTMGKSPQHSQFQSWAASKHHYARLLKPIDGLKSRST